MLSTSMCRGHLKVIYHVKLKGIFLQNVVKDMEAPHYLNITQVRLSLHYSGILNPVSLLRWAN